MKFFALIALFALATETEALSLNQLASADPAPAAEETKDAKPAPAPKAADKKKEKAPEETKVDAKVKDEGEDATKNSADAAVDAGVKASDEKAAAPRERTAAEKTRDHILGVARVGQEAIEANEKNLKEHAEKYAAQDKVWDKENSEGRSGSARAAAHDAEWARKGKEALEAAKTSTSEGEKWTLGMDKQKEILEGKNAAPILQSTAV